MKEIYQYIFAAFILLIFGGAFWWAEKTATPIFIENIKERRAEQLYKDSLESAYIFKTKALRIYMPIAIEKNSKK